MAVANPTLTDFVRTHDLYPKLEGQSGIIRLSNRINLTDLVLLSDDMKSLYEKIAFELEELVFRVVLVAIGEWKGAVYMGIQHRTFSDGVDTYMDLMVFMSSYPDKDGVSQFSDIHNLSIKDIIDEMKVPCPYCGALTDINDNCTHCHAPIK